VLSLDFHGDRFAGPSEILADAACWPDRVIVMTLARVGSGSGPDLARLAEVVARAGARSVYAAGGVRDRADVEALRLAGVAGVLVASALHADKITAGDLKAIAGC
jgi:phosphoribosylformimino-5-aminoimidazole carboxamide ribotide isomerase